jgi:sulfate adenylyltransferase subunit 1
MVTGASTADLAVILVDARKGVLEQTVRHTYIASLLDIRHVIFCINKMDMIDFSETIFLNIKSEIENLVRKLQIEDSYYLPISAKYGDNVVEPSEKMKWYHGKTFLRLVETIEIEKDKNSRDARFPVQTVIRPLSEEFHDYRGYAGRVAGGTFHKGDEVTVLPAMIKSRITGINIMDEDVSEASAGDSVTITLNDQVDISRGNLIIRNDQFPQIGQDIKLMACWFNEKPLKVGGKYIIRNYSNETAGIIKSVNYKMNINTLEKDTTDLSVNMNDIVNITIRTAKQLVYDSYRKNNITGSLIIIEEGTNETVAAGMIMGD